MRVSSTTRLIVIAILLLTVAFATFGEPPSVKLSEMLPSDLGSFHQLPSMRPLITLSREGALKPETFRAKTETDRLPFVGGEADYLSRQGEKLTVEILKFNGESDAYSFLTLVAERTREGDPEARINPAGIGTASVLSPRSVAFFKSTTFVRITKGNPSSKNLDSALALARLFADRIDKGEGEVPVLLKHLPSWEASQATAVYFVSLDALKSRVSNEPILDAVTFEGGAEAVAAKYGPSQFVIIEFTTPQLAGDNDRRIVAKIQELWKQGQPAPTAYRRVGNYSVFVFTAPDEKTANQLIDEVKYEQVVQWLGENPNWLKEAQRRYTEMTFGVFVSVVKASGVAAVLCFGIGGFFGALLFARRRAQQKTAEAYSDAGGMTRLNLDELSAETDAGRLIGSGRSDEL